MDGGTVTRDQPVTVYTEKSLGMAAGHRLPARVLGSGARRGAGAGGHVRAAGGGRLTQAACRRRRSERGRSRRRVRQDGAGRCKAASGMDDAGRARATAARAADGRCQACSPRPGILSNSRTQARCRERTKPHDRARGATGRKASRAAAHREGIEARRRGRRARPTTLMSGRLPRDPLRLTLTGRPLPLRYAGAWPREDHHGGTRAPDGAVADDYPVEFARGPARTRGTPSWCSLPAWAFVHRSLRGPRVPPARRRSPERAGADR